MNYLSKREARDKLVEEITEYVLDRVPEAQKSLYKSVLDSLGKTLHGLL